MELEQTVVGHFSPKSSIRSRGWQSLAFNHALFVTRATFAALIEFGGAMGIAAYFPSAPPSRHMLPTNGDSRVEARHNIRPFVRLLLPFFRHPPKLDRQTPS
jgi:hypothetical protein